MLLGAQFWRAIESRVSPHENINQSSSTPTLLCFDQKRSSKGDAILEDLC